MNKYMRDLVFSSVGDNTKFYDRWLGSGRKYDIWLVYYGDDEKIYKEYKKRCFMVEKHKGSKFQNLFYMYNKYRKRLLEQYERFFILDDDIIINIKQINRMFELSKQFNLKICQPSFDSTFGKVSWMHTKHNPELKLKFTNFIEVNSPLYNKESFVKLMEKYDPKLIGWGVDYLSIWVNGIDLKKSYAIIHEIKCINPKDNYKNENNRELKKVDNYDNLEQVWLDFKKENDIDWGRQEVLLANESWHNHESFKTYKSIKKIFKKRNMKMK